MIVQNQTQIPSKNYSEIKENTSLSSGKINLSNGNVIMMNNENNIKATLGYAAANVNLDRFKDSSDVVSTMPLGSEVGVVSTIGNWSEVIYNGYRGYVPSADIINTGNKIEVNSKTNQIINNGNQASSFKIETASGNAIANTKTYLNASPAATNTHLAVLQNGDILTLTGQINNWYQVKYNGQVGYVEKQDTTKLSAGTVTLQNTSDDNNVYETDGLTNAQLTETNVAIEAKAAEVCEGLTTNYQKAKAIYDWVATNIKYNSQDANTTAAALAKGSEAIEVFNTKSGICQGYADLYAAMCRAQGIQVKVVESNTHAWNQVYTPQTGWFSVDCTWAARAYSTPDVVANANGTYTNENNGYGYSTSNLQAINDPNYTCQYIYMINAYSGMMFSGNDDYFNNPNNNGWNDAAHQYLYTSSEGFMVIPNK